MAHLLLLLEVISISSRSSMIFLIIVKLNFLLKSLNLCPPFKPLRLMLSSKRPRRLSQRYHIEVVSTIGEMMKLVVILDLLLNLFINVEQKINIQCLGLLNIMELQKEEIVPFFTQYVCMLNNSSLLDFLWGKALRTTSYIL